SLSSRAKKDQRTPPSENSPRDSPPTGWPLPALPSQPGSGRMASMPITMYTTAWCGFCHRLKAQLGREGVEVVEVDIEADPEAAAFVEGVNGGNQTVPTLVFADGTTMTNPSLGQVKAHLGLG
ncbi:MAG: mycoredoxin, partial [Candidatus Nanopelagicales bacterium]|nr:mycoredoxin [Candidatus Nanopelagicales bacterium]